MRRFYPAKPWRRRWTRREYYRLSELGLFNDGRVELLEGEILRIPPYSNLMAVGIALTDEALRLAFGPGHWVRTRMPLDFGRWSVPDPDVAVIPGDPRSHKGEDNPTTALLVVEVSETTLELDRERKGRLYARWGIRDYWILNLVEKQLEVYRDPVPAADKRSRHRYATSTIVKPAEIVSPLAAPKASIKVADLLP